MSWMYQTKKDGTCKPMIIWSITFATGPQLISQTMSRESYMKRIKTLIREYVMDHYKHFGFYPMDVEVDDVLYTYEHYMRILSMPVN